MAEYMIKVENLSKQYILGQIGGTTLRDELQRLGAKLRGREDPTKVIGSQEFRIGETFLALENVSFAVKKGERVGIIGHNGAGKSTLLKLISRVTAPTSGRILLDGRITSMLEVGTGFHPELTGRENIYMNGAILGMTKSEIDSKMEDIIDFSECRQFIDTPVKRYSSGMYVKLAFSVAAHLDSEIMIMDEVLAVGDMAFQKKCIDKMNDVSSAEGRTILYVSHNMNTIRRLCDRAIVLSHGKINFDGAVEPAVEMYMNNSVELKLEYDYSNTERNSLEWDSKIHIDKAVFLERTNGPIYKKDEIIRLSLDFTARTAFNNLAFRCIVSFADGTRAGMATTAPSVTCKLGENRVILSIPVDWLAPGKYIVNLAAYTVNEYGHDQLHDVIVNALGFEKDMVADENNRMEWHHSWWGYIKFPEIGFTY